MNIFDELEQQDSTYQREAERLDSDIRDAVRQLMHRREGRVFINWLIDGQDPRTIMRRVMAYLEEQHV